MTTSCQQGEPIIEAIDVHRMFGATPVLRGIDLRVERSEWVALMGASGCGKSTLLHVLGGLDRVDAGTIRIANEQLSDRTASARADLRRRHLGFVFQYANLLPHLDARTNIELAGRLGGLRKSEARASA
jgi:putative ABC transport system ATP-binding protein